MSEDVTYKGKLKPVGKTPIELAYVLNIDLYEFCGENRLDREVMEAIDWEFEGKYILINGMVYEFVHNEQVHSISLATLNIDGTIDYIVQFYNGGASLDEAIVDTIKMHGIK